MCFCLFFPKVLFNSAFFSGLLLTFAQWLPPQRHYARLMISLSGSRQVQMDVEMLDALSKPLEVKWVWSERMVFFFQKEARGCWCSVKSTRRCFEWMIYWLMLLLKKTTSVVDNIWWKNLRLKWEISPCWHQLHQFLSSVKPNDGTEINIHTVFLAETQEVLADAMSGGGMAGVFCRLEIARSKGRVALWFFFSKQELYL